MCKMSKVEQHYSMVRKRVKRELMGKENKSNLEAGDSKRIPIGWEERG